MRTDIPKMFCLHCLLYIYIYIYNMEKKQKTNKKCIYDYACWCGWYGLHVYKILSMLQTSMCMKYCPPLKQRLYSLTPPHTHTHAYTHTLLHTPTHSHTYTLTHPHTHTSNHSHTHTHTDIHTYTHSHTPTLILEWSYGIFGPTDFGGWSYKFTAVRSFVTSFSQ